MSYANNIEICDGMYSEARCRQNPKKLYVFGDNEERIGHGGQAIIRSEPNAVGLATKESIMNFWSDKELESNKAVIDADIEHIKKTFDLGEYEKIVLPIAGFGFGLARIQTKAPRTAIYLCQRLMDEFNFNNLETLINRPNI